MSQLERLQKLAAISRALSKRAGVGDSIERGVESVKSGIRAVGSGAKTLGSAAKAGYKGAKFLAPVALPLAGGAALSEIPSTMSKRWKETQRAFHPSTHFKELELD